MERIAWLVLALGVHLPPFAALFVPSLLTRLYDVAPDDPNFALLQHRAALFGVVLVVCSWAAFEPAVRRLAFVAAALSMLSFLAIWVAYGRPESLIAIALGDLFGLLFLAYVGWKTTRS